MIEFLKGRLCSKTPGKAVVEVSGMGFSVTIPLTTYQALPAVGSEVFLKTDLVVREDGFELFGFSTSDERQLYKMLLTVSSVGPKNALSVVSSLSVGAFHRAVADDDFKAITVVPGIGPKIAKRIVLELKDKLSEVPFDATVGLLPGDGGENGIGRGAKPGFSPTADPRRKAAHEALVALGYTRAEIDRAFEGMSIAPGAAVNQIVQDALDFFYKG